MAENVKNPERVFMHDIATPIAVALGLVDLIMDDSASGVCVLPEASAKRLEKVQAALVKLQQMIVDRRRAILEQATLSE